jgi:CPA2 family monovalent cation:H+ antiporter-2
MAVGSPLLAAGVVFAALAVASVLALRVDQSVIPAYILAGVLLGPHAPVEALRLVESREFVVLLRELGIVLLLFFIGLEFNLDRLSAARDRMLRAGAVDIGINGAVGAVIGLVIGFTAFESLLLAGIVAISSSAVITKSLIELGWIADPESDAILGLLVVEDVVVAVYLAVLAAVGLSTGFVPAVTSLAISLAVIGLLVALALRGRGLLERLLATDSDESFLLRVVGVTVLVAGLALAAGVSEAVAAFFLGTAVGTTSHHERVARVITSERDLYAAVFFFAIGLETEPALVAGVLGPLALLVAVTTLSKLASGYWGGRLWGLDERRSTRVGLAMVARGEFSLVIAALAVAAGADPRVVALAVGYVFVMSVLGTVLMRGSGRIERAVVARTADR